MEKKPRRFICRAEDNGSLREPRHLPRREYCEKEDLPKERSDNDAKLKKVLDTIAAMDDSQVADAFAKAESDDSANTAAVSSGDFERGIRQHISTIIEKCKEDVRNGQNR